MVHALLLTAVVHRKIHGPVLTAREAGEYLRVPRKERKSKY